MLGFRNRSARINAVNRWRVRIGLRSVSGPDTLVVFSGGAASGRVSEARLMADHAASLGFAGRFLLEEQSRSTWQNTTHVIPLVEHADRIRIASQPAHALKARAYVRRQRPDLAARLVPADDHRFGELALLKPVLALHGLRTLRALTRAERRGRLST